MVDIKLFIRYESATIIKGLIQFDFLLKNNLTI